MDKQTILDAIDAALRAGRRILEIYNDPASDFQVERKADNSPLTIADREAHELIASRLASLPYPLLSEEGKHLPYEVRKTWHSLWIVDPLDGTKEFIKRNGEFTVNIALVTNGVPVAGVIYVPVLRTLYFGAEGWGAYRLDEVDALQPGDTWEELLRRSRRLPLNERHEGVVVVASRSHLSPETESFIEVLRARSGEVRTLSCGSSIKLCRVAEGVADVYPRFAPTMEWDTAAGHAIARAAGCEVYHTDSPLPLRYNKEDLLNPWFVVEPRRTPSAAAL